jgi:hypothetical protein
LATYVSRFSSRPLNMELGILFCAILISRIRNEGDHAPLKRDSNHEMNCKTKETWWNKKQGHCKF